MFSSYLNGIRGKAKELVSELLKSFEYVSLLATDNAGVAYMADRRNTVVREGVGECGFVLKLHNGRAFYEYSFSDISKSVSELASEILTKIQSTPALNDAQIECDIPQDEPLIKSFIRESDFDKFSDSEVLDFCKTTRDSLLKMDEKILNATVIVQPYTVSKLFISKNRELDQHYGWANAFAVVTYRDGKIVRAREGSNGYILADIMSELPTKLEKLYKKAVNLSKAKPIEPGYYDVITDSSITGLIAHEAFGHGVEMDQFVKDRALAKEYVGKYVASPISNMHDGAAATLSAASYFFDDDGVLAHDTQIIKDGILVAGISDLVSATELGTEPTGNGRRQSYKRKAYSRMTNTFFCPGSDKLEDMIASIKHGYMLFETNNGMEDPKNWQIQCTAEYGIEIVDGKLTDNYVSPVVMSGSVPELLKSISMVSDDFKIIGAGSCGKGYKEWVRVSDGGPALKVRVKLA
jgi:TldD protein